MNIKNLMKHKLVQAGSWYTFTNFFTQGIAFLTIPIFTRLLTTSDYGMVSLYGTWVGLFSVFISLDLAWSVQRAKFDFEDNYNQYISSVLFLSLLLLGLFGVIFVILEDFFIKLTDLPKMLFYFMIFQAYFSFVQNYSLEKFRVEYKYKLVSIINISISIIGVIISIYLIKYVFIGEEYLGKILGSGFLVVIVGTIYSIYFLIKGKKFVSLEYWKYALAISLPFILHNISGIINSQFDRIFINMYVGTAETGIYSFAYNIGTIISVLSMSFYQARGPYMLEKMINKEYGLIIRMSRIFRDIFSIIYAAILLVSPEIVKIMAPESYLEGLDIVPFIFMSYYFNFMSAFETGTEYFHKKTKYITIGTMVAAVINVVLNFIFIPIYGYFAAAVTTVISYFVLLIYHYYITRRVLRNPIYGAKFHLLSLAYVIVITVFFLIFKEILWMRLMGVVILGIISYRLIVRG